MTDPGDYTLFGQVQFLLAHADVGAAFRATAGRVDDIETSLTRLEAKLDAIAKLAAANTDAIADLERRLTYHKAAIRAAGIAFSVPP